MTNTYRIEITVKGLPEDETEYEDALKEIEDVISSVGYECDFGIGECE